jgi:hypothetical protein
MLVYIFPISTVLVFLILWVYLLPSFLAAHRRHHNIYNILAINALLGWSFIGWVLALVWSLTAVVDNRASNTKIVTRTAVCVALLITSVGFAVAYGGKSSVLGIIFIAFACFGAVCAIGGIVEEVKGLDANRRTVKTTVEHHASARLPLEYPIDRELIDPVDLGSLDAG